MFCSVKKGKYKSENTYKFYLCNRYRDKETKKVKSNDIYITTLMEEDIRDFNTSFLKKHINKILKEKNILNDENIGLIINKILDTKEYIKEQYRRIQEEEHRKREEKYRKQQEEFKKQQEKFNEYFNNFSSGMSSINFDDTTKDLAKEFIKLGFKAMAKKYHPDLTKDNGEKMKLINDIKRKLNKTVE